MKTKTIVIMHLILLIILVGCSSTPEPRIIKEIKVFDNVEDNEKALDRFKIMDAHALAAPESVKSSMVNLVDYLIEPAQTDLEKIRVIYRWITENIAYDRDAVKSGTYGDLSPEGVLTSGKSVCSGYAGLFKNLMDLAGVPVVEISGYAKGISYTDGDHFTKTNHAWNAVKIKDKWYLIDTTWASGLKSINGKRKFIEGLDDFWFFTPPDQFIFSHLPEVPEWQLLDEEISKDRFEELPNAKGRVFNLGMTSSQVLEEFESVNYRGLPIFYTIKSANLTARDVPLIKYLEKDKVYNFKFYSEEIKSIALIERKNFSYFDHENNEFSISFRPSLSGSLKIGYSTIGKGSSHYIFIQYEVE